MPAVECAREKQQKTQRLRRIRKVIVPHEGTHCLTDRKLSLLTTKDVTSHWATVLPSAWNTHVRYRLIRFAIPLRAVEPTVPHRHSRPTYESRRRRESRHPEFGRVHWARWRAALALTLMVSSKLFGLLGSLTARVVVIIHAKTILAPRTSRIARVVPEKCAWRTGLALAVIQAQQRV
jgi:hypothetical protein